MAMTDPLSSPITAASNSVVDVNLNINLNPESTVHYDMHKVKYRQPDTLNELRLFETLRQIRVSCAKLKVTSFVYFIALHKVVSSLERFMRHKNS